MLVPMFLFLAGILLLLLGLYYEYFRQSPPHSDTAALPQSVAGLLPTQTSYGAEAIAEISQMHGQEFELSSGAAARYGQPGTRVTLWVTGTTNEQQASRLVNEMETAIARGESPFEPMGTRQVDSRRVYQLTGMGQQHFYFRSANFVVWLAADAAIAENALAEMLSFYP